MKTCEMWKKGNVECYMAPLGEYNKAANPVFSVMEQTVVLSGNTIGHFLLNGNFETTEEQKESVFQVYKNRLKNEIRNASQNEKIRFICIEYLCNFPKIDPYVMAASLMKDGINIVYDDSSISRAENNAKEKRVKQLTI